MAESIRVFSLQWRILSPIIVFLLFSPIVSGSFFKPFNVSYDHRALIVAGKRRMLVSAGIHYPRATPEMWSDLITKSKEGGADVIQTYVFWNGHEPVKGQYNFEGRYDLVKFVKLIGSSGLYLHLRIGPYVCAEWNFGGFPVWLRDIPGIEFRTDNEPFKKEMQKFVTKIVDLMREAKLFCWQGGPIIMLQIENEYGDVEKSYGQKGKDYVKWAASMALGLGAGVPWVMCKQTDAPENIIDACNGYYCDGFKPNSQTKPVLWTEDWDGWYTKWGGSLPHRPAEDLAFAVARFYQRGGSFQNYYMYFGGTNFGRTSGGPFYITSYDYDAPLDEYGLRSEPKWGHLKDLHAAIKLCEPALVAADTPQYRKLGSNQEAHIYRGDGETGGKVCAAFLANIDEHRSAHVNFNGQSYTLPPWSVSILPDCRHVAFNTAKVGAQTSVKTVESARPSLGSMSILQKVMRQDNVSYISKSWMALKEPIGIWGENNFTFQGFLEHLNVTKDWSDYLWHKTRITVTEDDISFWKKNGANSTVSIDSMRDVLRVFVNKQLSGNLQHFLQLFMHVCNCTHAHWSCIASVYGCVCCLCGSLCISTQEGHIVFMKCKVLEIVFSHLWLFFFLLLNGSKGSVVGHWVKAVQPVTFVQGNNDLLLLTQTVGLQNYGAFLEKDGAGFRGKVKLTGFKNGDMDLSKSSWTYQVGLKGEAEKIYTVEHNEKAEWSTLETDVSPSIFMWYKTYFDTPDGTDPVVLDLESMGKGQVWVNAYHIGRYWNIISQKDGCERTCDYRGAYNSDKCTTNCGKPTQTRYHVPRSWLKPSSNLLVLFEETGGDPFKISVKTVTAGILCGQVSESHYPPLRKWSTPDYMNGTMSINSVAPEVHLHCEDGHVISSIEFASYGTPRGSCDRFSIGKCHASDSLSIVSEACKGRNSCFIEVSNTAFRSDPCSGTLKTLAVTARCSLTQNKSDLGF